MEAVNVDQPVCASLNQPQILMPFNISPPKNNGNPHPRVLNKYLLNDFIN